MQPRHMRASHLQCQWLLVIHQIPELLGDMVHLRVTLSWSLVPRSVHRLDLEHLLVPRHLFGCRIMGFPRDHRPLFDHETVYHRDHRHQLEMLYLLCLD